MGSFSLQLPERAVTGLKCGWKVAPFGFSSHMEELISTVSGGGTPELSCQAHHSRDISPTKACPHIWRGAQRHSGSPNYPGWRGESQSQAVPVQPSLGHMWGCRGRAPGDCTRLSRGGSKAAKEGINMVWDQHFTTTINFVVVVFPCAKARIFQQKTVLLGSLLILQ